MAVETKTINIGLPVNRNVDSVINELGTEYIIDGYVDEELAVNKRPALSEYANLNINSPVDGIWYNQKDNFSFVVAGGNLYTLTSAGAVTQITTPFKLASGVVPEFEYVNGKVYITTGSGLIAFTIATLTAAAVTDVDLPANISSLCQIDGYLIATKTDTNFIHFSALDDGTNWDSLDFFQAAGSFDNVVCARVRERELYLFGQTTTEIWENNGQDPFGRLPGGFIETGCSAARSTITHESGVYWLDNKRKFVKYVGRGVENIPCPFYKEIQDFPRVSDCSVSYQKHGQEMFFIWRFPSAQKAFVYHLNNDRWYEWALYNSALAIYEEYLGSCSAYEESAGFNFVGSRKNDGKIYRSIRAAYRDGVNTIRMLVRTGNISHGTVKQKRSNELRFVTKKGFNNSTSTSGLSVRWRDDNNINWSNEHYFPLGAQGQSYSIQRLKRTGIYRRRQWEFIFTDNLPLSIAKVEEDVEVLR